MWTGEGWLQGAARPCEPGPHASSALRVEAAYLRNRASEGVSHPWAATRRSTAAVNRRPSCGFTVAAGLRCTIVLRRLAAAPSSAANKRLLRRRPSARRVAES